MLALRAMTLEQLRIFVAVAEREHMTRAAEVLHLTQSAVSAAISTLEAAYSTTLFHRVGRRIELTEAGRLFRDEARAVLARAAAAEQALVDLGGLKRGTLALQASQTVASYWLPRHLVAFQRIYPEVQIRLAIGNTVQVVKSLIDGIAELGFAEGPVGEPALSAERIECDRLVLVVAPQHPWATLDRLQPRDLSESDWVLREVGSGTRSVLEAALSRLGVAPNSLKVVLELPSNEAVREAVEAGAGATVTSQLVAEAGLRSGALRRVAIDLPQRPFFIVRHRERHRSKAAEALVALLKGSASDAGVPRAVGGNVARSGTSRRTGKG